MVPQIEAELAQLNHGYSVHKTNYDALVARRESASIAVDMNTQTGVADFRVIDPPTLATKPSEPNRMLLIPLAGLFPGLAAGFALTFLISQLRPAFSDPRSLREVTGLPVLGTVSCCARTRGGAAAGAVCLRVGTGCLCRRFCGGSGGLAADSGMNGINVESY